MSDPIDSTKPGADSNPDPLTGEPGSHPVGTGIGAAGVGATATAIGGAVGGPIGAVVGAAVGAVAGGLAGKGVAESIDPTVHDEYWKQKHATQPYAGNGPYDQYSGAYRTGYRGMMRHGTEKSYTDVESDLKSEYESTKDHAAVGWEHAKEATKAAYEHARNEVTKL